MMDDLGSAVLPKDARRKKVAVTLQWAGCLMMQSHLATRMLQEGLEVALMPLDLEYIFVKDSREGR